MLHPFTPLSLLCAAALGFLLFSLSAAITIVRLRRQVLVGCNGDPQDRLTKLVRAQGNTAEYAPLLALFMLLLGTQSPGTWVSGLMVLATASRYLFVLGMLISPTIARPNLVRAAGACGTYVAGFGLTMAVAGLAG
ncbi:MAPEG family protein [Chitinimonas sp.]|uniref:MAPEG family protein n=1 Tax=Chitinimonas sp. TaxID=1934313 RepID=UPI002F93D80C